MKRKRFFCGFTLIEMVMVLVIIGLLAAIVVPKFEQIRAEAGEVFAKKTLQTMSFASELYAKDKGFYPASMTLLLVETYHEEPDGYVVADPPYLKREVCGTVEGGYAFTCTMSVSGYSLTATAVNEPRVLTITTGGVWQTSG